MKVVGWTLALTRLKLQAKNTGHLNEFILESRAIEICYLDFKSFTFSDADIMLESQANPVVGSIYIIFWK
jgi:hypothetical protein